MPTCVNRPEEGGEPSGAVLTGSPEPPDTGAGN